MSKIDGDHPKLTREQAEKHCILKVVVGSHIHGLNIPTSDVDIEAIVVEPLESVVRMGQPFEDLVIETPTEDVKYISLRKWCWLALNGNPNFLLPLFAPATSIIGGYALGSQLRDMKGCFASKRAGKSHLGYMNNQRKRLLSHVSAAYVDKITNMGHGRMRDDLVVEHGYDTKFGMHLLRLGMQGVEFCKTGALTLPLPEPARAYLLNVRAGNISVEEVLKEADQLEGEMKAELDVSPLPDEPRWDEVEDWMQDVYMNNWQSAKMVKDLATERRIIAASKARNALRDADWIEDTTAAKVE